MWQIKCRKLMCKSLSESKWMILWVKVFFFDAFQEINNKEQQRKNKVWLQCWKKENCQATTCSTFVQLSHLQNKLSFFNCINLLKLFQVLRKLKFKFNLWVHPSIHVLAVLFPSDLTTVFSIQEYLVWIISMETK